MWWLGYFVGVGLSWSYLEDSYDGMHRSGAVDLGGVYLVDPELGFGLHVRGSHVEGGYGDGGGPRSMDTSWSLYTCDVAATAHVRMGPFLLAPWFGVELAHGDGLTVYSFYEPDPRPPAERHHVGLTAQLVGGGLLAVDVWQSGLHGVAIYGELERTGSAGGVLGASTALTLGLAYRR
jgi:hypothetical protein